MLSVSVMRYLIWALNSFFICIFLFIGVFLILEFVLLKTRAAQKGQQWQRRCQKISLQKPFWQEISLRTIHVRKFGVDQSGNI
jgi:hypothetical protein